MTETQSKTYLAYIPHGINTKRFYPLPDTNETLIETRKNLFGGADVNFVMTFNSRNIHRKHAPDIILAFAEFMKKLSPDQQDKCRFVMHTQPVDDNGTDLPVVIRDLVPQFQRHIIFSPHRTDTDYLNYLYNISDVTINLSSNEGFGLGACESIMAGTPIIVNVTGGLQDQCGFTDDDGNYLDPDTHFTKEWGTNADGRYTKHGEWAFPILPSNRSLQGSPLTPYIFDDRARFEDAADKIMEVYLLGREERKRRGELGRQYGLGFGQFTAARMSDLFIEHIDGALKQWKPRRKFELVKA